VKGEELFEMSNEMMRVGAFCGKDRGGSTDRHSSHQGPLAEATRG
jgi:hypothetical protein